MNANKQDAGGLPPLPEPVEIYCGRWADYGYGYTSDQMRAYGEQCRAASVDSGRLASKLEDVRDGIADVLTIVSLETIDDAIEALRALSRGVPEGMVLVPVEPTPEMETAHRMYGDTSDWWQAVISAAIAAQRKEGE